MELSVYRRLTETGAHLLEVEGRLDLETSPLLQTELRQVLDDGARQLVIDLSQLAFLDSAGMAVFFSARNAVREAGGRLVLAGPNETVLRILRRTGVVRVIPVHESLETALQDVSTPE